MIDFKKEKNIDERMREQFPHLKKIYQIQIKMKKRRKSNKNNEKKMKK